MSQFKNLSTHQRKMLEAYLSGETIQVDTGNTANAKFIDAEEFDTQQGYSDCRTLTVINRFSDKALRVKPKVGTVSKLNAPKNYWLSVSNYLPCTTRDDMDREMSDLVLVFNDRPQVARRVWDEFDGMFYWRSNCSEGWRLDGVTHWMYLPDKPSKP